MKRNRFEQICEDIEHGVAHAVEHEITHREGKVVACHRDSFIIDSEDHTERWARQNCTDD